MMLLVLILQLLAGIGLARRLGTFTGLQQAALGLLLGLPVSTVVVFLMEVLGVPITLPFFLAGSGLAALILNLDWVRSPQVPDFRSPRPRGVALFEWPALLILFTFCAVSMWRCILLPVTPRDAIVGMDLVAKYAVAEGTLNSSVFTSGVLDGQLSNQPYYAPFVTLMQVIYRLVAPFGKLWIGILFSAFTVFLYGALRERVHALVSGFLVVALISTQGLFTYSFFVVTDMVNAVFFGMSVFFAEAYRRSPTRGHLLGASLFMAFACWSRSEMVLMVPLGMAIIWTMSPKESSRLGRSLEFALWPLVLFLAWHWLYFTFYFDAAPSSNFAPQLPGAGALGLTLKQMFNLTFVSKLLGTLPYLFVAALLWDMLVLRRRQGGTLLLWMGGLVVMLLFVVHFFPAASMAYTGKRGFVKLLPVMVFYVAASPTVAVLSQKLGDWERGRGGSPKPKARVRGRKRR